MEETAEIRIFRDRNGARYYWNGPEHGIVGISYALMELEPDLIPRLPWRLQEVGRDDLKMVVYFQRAG
jgi:hypothetical protein